MGLLSYVRDRKQVKASRAGEGIAKLSAGDFSHFGGQRGAMQPKSKREAGAPDYHPKNPHHDWDSNADVWGRTGAMKNTEALSRNTNETPEEETARGARIKVTDNVTILGDKWSKNHGRAPINAETRGRIDASKRKNADQYYTDDLPSKEEALKVGKQKTSVWDED